MSFQILLLVVQLFQLVPTCLAVPAPTTIAIRDIETPSPTVNAEFALTTTFVPPETCTSQRLTQLASPLFQLWMNEPRPALSVTIGDCYPTQFMRNYTSTSFASQVPPMSPLVCPQYWSTVLSTAGYAACCPENYTLNNPSSVNSIRPAFGGTCYSAFTIGQTITMTAYNSLSVTGTLPWVASTAGAQAYAHIIDGYIDGAAVPPSSTAPALQTSLSPADDPYAHPAEPMDLPPSTVAGITIGALSALLALLALGFLAYRSRHKNGPSGLVELPADYKLQEMSADKVVYRYELGDGMMEAKGVTEEDMGVRMGVGAGVVSPGLVSPMGPLPVGGRGEVGTVMEGRV